MSDSDLHTDLTENQAASLTWKRWLPEPIQPPRLAAKAGAPAPDPQREAASLRQKIQKAHEQAQQDGHQQGYAKGHEQGLKEGQEQGHTAGYEAGYAQGRAAGYEHGLEEATQAAAQMSALAQECATALQQLEEDVGQALVDLSVRIAEQVVHSTVAAHPEKLLELIGDMIRMQVDDAAALQLYVNPDDLQQVQAYLQDEPDARRWRIIPDDTITRGGCKARTALGDIDATLETRWQRVVSTLGRPA